MPRLDCRADILGPMDRRRALIMLLWLLVAWAGAEAKCIVFSVVLEGKVASSGGQREVLVRIHTNRGKEIIEQKAVPAENGSFTVNVPIDAFVSAGLFGSHNCSRRPNDVEAVLLKNGVPIQTVRLGIGQDFDWDATRAEWRTKLPVVLNGSKGS